MTLSRRDVFKRGGMIGAGAALAAPGLGLAAPVAQGGHGILRAQDAKRKVIFVTHDDNPFFIPVRFALEEFGAMAGWETQWVGPPAQDEQATLQFQLDAIASKPDAVGFTRVNTTMFDDAIRQAQDAGIAIVLFNAASDGYQDLGVAYVGQEFIAAGQVSGQNAAKYAQEMTGRTDGKIVLGTIAPGHSALDQRMEGARQGIAAYNEANGTNFVTEDLTTSTDGPTAIAAIDAKYAQDGSDIVGFAHADFVHWFTATWIEQNGYEGKFANGGFDLVPGVLDAIAQGNAQWSIGQNPYAQGWISSALLSMQMEHNYPAFSYDTGAEVVDASNIEMVTAREAVFNE